MNAKEQALADLAMHLANPDDPDDGLWFHVARQLVSANAEGVYLPRSVDKDYIGRVGAHLVMAGLLERAGKPTAFGQDVARAVNTISLLVERSLVAERMRRRR